MAGVRGLGSSLDCLSVVAAAAAAAGDGMEAGETLAEVEGGPSRSTREMSGKVAAVLWAGGCDS